MPFKNIKRPVWIREHVECEWCHKNMEISDVEVVNSEEARVTYTCFNSECKDNKREVREFRNGFGFNRIEELRKLIKEGPGSNKKSEVSGYKWNFEELGK